MAMKVIHGAQFELSVDGVPRSYRDRRDIALYSAQLLKSRNPHSVVKVKDLQTGEEIIIAFILGKNRRVSAVKYCSRGTHSQTKGRDNREHKLRPTPAGQSSTLPVLMSRELSQRQGHPRS
jgi:hypothetical protein